MYVIDSKQQMDILAKGCLSDLIQLWYHLLFVASFYSSVEKEAIVKSLILCCKYCV